MSCNCQTTTAFIPLDEIDDMRGWEPSPSLPRLIAAEPREGFRVWVKFDDGEEGEVDYSDIPRDGVFAVWNDPEFFKQVRISEEFKCLEWPGELDFCPDATYMRLTGKTVWELMPKTRKYLENAGTV